MDARPVPSNLRPAVGAHNATDPHPWRKCMRARIAIVMLSLLALSCSSNANLTGVFEVPAFNVAPAEKVIEVGETYVLDLVPADRDAAVDFSGVGVTWTSS